MNLAARFILTAVGAPSPLRLRLDAFPQLLKLLGHTPQSQLQEISDRSTLENGGCAVAMKVQMNETLPMPVATHLGRHVVVVFVRPVRHRHDLRPETIIGRAKKDKHHVCFLRRWTNEQFPYCPRA